MSHPYIWTCQRPLTASLTTCYWGNCEHTDSQTKHVLLSVVTSVTGNSELSWDHATVTGLKSSRVYHKALFWALFFSISLLMIFHILDRSSLYNYAGDNTLSYAHSNPDTLIHILQHDSYAILRWSRVNRTAPPPYDGSESTGLLCHPTMVQSQPDEGQSR